MKYQCWITDDIEDLENRKPDFECEHAGSARGAAGLAAEWYSETRKRGEDGSVSIIVQSPEGLVTAWEVEIEVEYHCIAELVEGV